MINDFADIKDEKDRECYVMIRQIIDRFFMETLEDHKQNKDHNYHECFNENLEEFKKASKKYINKDTPLLTLVMWAEHNTDELIRHIQGLICIAEEYDNRGVKH